jgi:competence ComEA-like helix-hairpin-helix protein
MRLFILSLALLVVLSCRSGNSAPNSNSATASSNRTREASGAPAKPIEPCVNLNIATLEDLTRLPGIGEVVAKRIIEYRDHHGRFRRPEEIIIIEGFSENKYRAIAALLCVE